MLAAWAKAKRLSMSAGSRLVVPSLDAVAPRRRWWMPLFVNRVMSWVFVPENRLPGTPRWFSLWVRVKMLTPPKSQGTAWPRDSVATVKVMGDCATEAEASRAAPTTRKIVFILRDKDTETFTGVGIYL